MPLHIETPLVESPGLSAASGFRVFVKEDCLQPSGSFKIRGLGHLCTLARARGAKEFVCASGGNAGLAAAHAGRILGVPVVIYLPVTSAAFIKDRIVAFGATVRVEGAVWNESDLAARAYVAEGGETRAYIPAFDHPDVWDGNSTVISEAVAQSGGKFDFDAVVCAVGGGGLYNGIVRGLEAIGRPDVPIIAVETEGANCFNEALRVGEPVTMPSVTSIAKSLGSLRVSDETFNCSKRHPTHSILVTDRQAVDAVVRFLDEHRLLVEPACGAALAAIYFPETIKALNIKPGSKVLVVACGGSAVTLELLTKWLAEIPK